MVTSILAFCYPSFPATLRQRVSVCLTSLLASALNHTVRNVVELASHLSTLLDGVFLSIICSLFSAIMREKDFIFAIESRFLPFLVDVITHAMRVQQFSLHVFYMIAGDLFFLFFKYCEVLEKMILLTMLCYSIFLSFVIIYIYFFQSLSRIVWKLKELLCMVWNDRFHHESFFKWCYPINSGKVYVGVCRIMHLIVNFNRIEKVMNYFEFILHCPPKVKVEPALLFSSFVHNSSINGLKNVKLNENVCYEMINWILYYCGFGNRLQTNNNEICN